jgi:hypothetical protein
MSCSDEKKISLLLFLFQGGKVLDLGFLFYFDERALKCLTFHLFDFF